MADAEGGVSVVMVAEGKITGIDAEATCCPIVTDDPPNSAIFVLTLVGVKVSTITCNCPVLDVDKVRASVPSEPAMSTGLPATAAPLAASPTTVTAFVIVVTVVIVPLSITV